MRYDVYVIETTHWQFHLDADDEDDARRRVGNELDAGEFRADQFSSREFEVRIADGFERRDLISPLSSHQSKIDDKKIGES